MILRISNTNYNVSTAFMTLVHYRAYKNKSYMDIENPTQEDLIELIYNGIIGDRPNIIKFKNQCETDTSFLVSAFAFQSKLFAKDSKHKIKKKTDTEEQDTDEMYLLAMYALTGLPANLLEMMTISQISMLIEKYFDIKNPSKAKIMSSNERKSMYGINSETELKIEQALKEGASNGIQ